MSKKNRPKNESQELELDYESKETDSIDNKPLHLGDPANHLDSYYSKWFLEYASYVILERAVPNVLDGLKPVQRRILHSLRELDDGRFNKVANAIGNTMKYHPHGDASIGDAMVQIGQKNLLLDTQGNWGNIYTGDSAAAPVISKLDYLILQKISHLILRLPIGSPHMMGGMRSQKFYR